MSFLNKITVALEKRQLLLLDEVKDSRRQSIIYGAGVYAYVLHRYLTNMGIQIKAFSVDRVFKSSDQFMGIDVIAIEDVILELNDCHVFVGVANYPAAVEKLREKGVANPWVVDVPDFLNIPEVFMNYDFVKSHEKEFEKAYDLFEDDLSRETYIAAINTKLNVDLSFIKPFVRLDHLYFSKGEFLVGIDETLLDVGGFNGDSIKDFHNILKGRYRKIISLEPFPKLNQEVRKTIDQLGISDRCVALQVGAWYEKATLSFNKTDMEIDSKILKGGTEKIEVDTIDSLFSDPTDQISFMKLDINGAEFNALKGAEAIIRRDRPKIAVKMHVKEDFYRLPILLKEISPDMKIYLRQRNYMSMMLVLQGLFK